MWEAGGEEIESSRELERERKREREREREREMRECREYGGAYRTWTRCQLRLLVRKPYSLAIFTLPCTFTGGDIPCMGLIGAKLEL